MNEIANAFHNQNKCDQSKKCINHSGKITKSGLSLSHSLPYIHKFMSKLNKSCTWKFFSQGTCIGIQLVQHMTQLFLVQSTDSLQFFFFFSMSQRVLISVQ